MRNWRYEESVTDGVEGDRRWDCRVRCCLDQRDYRPIDATGGRGVNSGTRDDVLRVEALHH